MKINFKKVFYLIIASSIIGLIINFTRPGGLSLIRESKHLVWADSAQIDNNSIKIKNESSISVKSSDNNDADDNQKKENVAALKNKKDDSKKVAVKAFEEPILINLEQAYKLYKKNVVFLDARENEDYSAGHIKNALSLPYYDFSNHKQVLENLDKSSTLVIYCAGTDCDLSILLGKQLSETGYKRVYIFFGGWNDWLNAEYPVDKK